MGSTPGCLDEEHSNSNKDKRSPRSSSLKSSSSSTRSSSSSLLLSPSSPPSTDLPSSSLRSMDDLWQDINLSSLQTPAAATASSAVHGDVILQDFLGGGGGGGGGPFSEDPTPSSRKRACDPGPSPPSSGLTSGSGLRSREKGARVRRASQARGRHAAGEVSRACDVCTMKPPPNVHGTPPVAAAFPPPLKRKSSTANSGDSSDRRFLRLMKNRESAERSRARKQAYVMELENEVGRLYEENDRLRREQKQFFVAAAAAQLPKKRSLRRTFTSPF